MAEATDCTLVEASSDAAATMVDSLCVLSAVLVIVCAADSSSVDADDTVATAYLKLPMLSDPAIPYLDSESFINYLRSIKTVRLALFFREGRDGFVHVSMRSKGAIDVSAFARKFGGGGHRRAAACHISGDLDAIRARLLPEATALVRNDAPA